MAGAEMKDAARAVCGSGNLGFGLPAAVRTPLRMTRKTGAQEKFVSPEKRRGAFGEHREEAAKGGIQDTPHD